MDKKYIKDTYIFIKRFFVNYFWIGLVLILLTLVFENKYPESSNPLKILIELLKNVGIAVLIASIFSFAASTNDFIENIKKLLREIVIDRNFLGNVDEKSKRTALNALIKPTVQEKMIYSNIEDYYNMYINKTLDITKKNVRSDYNVNVRVFWDLTNQRIAADHIISYRLYPTHDGFSNIKIGFKEIDELSYCEYVNIFTPAGEKKEFSKPKLDTIQQNDGINRFAEVDLKDIGRDIPHLKVEIRIVEYGHDHWIALPFQALQPTDGIKYFLRCDNEIEVVSHQTFGQGVNFYIDRTNNEINISCNEWINEGSGIMVIASKK